MLSDQGSQLKYPESTARTRYIDFVPSGSPAQQGVLRAVHDPLGLVGALAGDRKTAKEAVGWA